MYWPPVNTVGFFHDTSGRTNPATPRTSPLPVSPWDRQPAPPHFTAAEVQYITGMLASILNESARNISLLGMAIRALVTQMGDADRLRIIDEAGDYVYVIKTGAHYKHR